MTGVRRSSGCWANRAVSTATSSASACSAAFDRRTWAASLTPGGSPDSGWGAVGARLRASPLWALA
eukprot:309452-Alexandrium_andersonii.AAC.1